MLIPLYFEHIVTSPFLCIGQMILQFRWFQWSRFLLLADTYIQQSIDLIFYQFYLYKVYSRCFTLARPTSQYILFDGENISFVASLVVYTNSTNIPPIMIINRIYEHQNLLSL
jgi:hypothetical protein